ncbi:ATP-dependent nuclease [Bradyrhizobium manausense]|uniref:ATP-dependent nuclease n=1 Tax=Bradyrhizobium manausense TaxID=989370 RepID=UPI001BA97968|nr:AAA family ATPase [Bradyrhizobium manausense]MBR0725908.1 AAA family ATPase [Bradyrhizobium manausense]
METFRVTVKNYRGFSDQAPARFEIGPGLTAFVGSNNVGKSALKLLVYELRPLFELLSRPFATRPNLFFATTGEQLSCGNYPGTSDPVELFNNTNDRGITIEFEVVGASPSKEFDHTINRVVVKCSRAAPMNWQVDAFSFQSPKDRVRSFNGYVDRDDTTVADSSNTITYYFGYVLDAFKALRSAKYYGAFRNALNEGSGQYFDFQIGTAFIELWNNWKTAGNIAHSRAIGKITEEIRRLFEFEQLEINASLSLKTLIVSIDGHPYRLSALGSGISQFIMALGNAATARPTLILIDEPETNLHPALQIDFLLTLAQYARIGCIFSTHSIGLARSVAERVYSVQRSKLGPVVRPFAATTSYSEFLGELSFTSFKEMGCDRILLVEGVHDVKVVQQMLRLLGKEHTTVILPLGGDQMAAGHREIELAELKRLSNNVSVLVDSERFNSNEPAAERRQQFAETCTKIGFQVCVTGRRAIENYLPDHAVKAALGEGFSALTEYERMAEHANGWAKADNWRIAHFMNKADLLSTDVGQFLERI